MIRIDFRSPQVRGADHLHFYRRAHRAANQLLHVTHQSIQVGRFRLQRLAPGKSQQPMSQCGGSLGGTLGRDDVALRLFIASLQEATAQQLKTPRDRHQQIVEVMSDAAGELSDGLHFLRLPQLVECGRQLGSHLPLLGNVASAAIEFARFRHCGPRQPAIFAVGSPVSVLETQH